MKQKIYIDIDDVLINTSEVVIELLNLTYDLNPPKTIYDLKDWEYRSIYRYRDYNLKDFGKQRISFIKFKFPHNLLNYINKQKIKLNGYFLQLELKKI